MTILERKKSGRRSKRPDMETLDEIYKKHTAYEIGTFYGVSENTVYSWVHRYREELKRAEEKG